ncbi:nucleotidyltransferase family protein [Wenzhouxiangella sp. EGI_FJ10305]|uniref:nucleotidyltransferase family protein n=1 Tax=Wenzhouxiangella sp. EGI_FJ10305 TaxID=3243768 RepID=UPI0035DEA8BC
MVRSLKAGPERIPAHDVAGQLRWLREHRLVALSGLLQQRGMISADVASLARGFEANKPTVGEAQMAEEKRVFAGLASAAVPALALKGARLAWSIYDHPAQRPRTDMDVLVAPKAVAQGRTALESLDYRPLNPVAGGTPIEQEAWIHDGAHGRSMVDLHWKLRNHPCLRDRLDFDEQWAEAIALPGLCEGARGQSAAHALLNASMHWFDSIHGERYPLVWLLDKDLLWRGMNEEEHGAVCELAGERGLAGLLAESLRLTRAAFATPIDDDVIDQLIRAGQGRTPTRLIALRHRRLRAFWFALWCEKGLRDKLWRLRQSVLPPAEHMRRRFPGGSRLGLPGLYWQRIRRRLERHRRLR